MNELPDWLVEPLHAVLGDMRVRPARLRFDGEYLWLRAGGERIGLWTGHETRGAELIVLIADRLQDELAETRDAWGEARPPCSGHPHPASPDLLDGEAWWVCPREGRRIGRIGEL